MQSIVQRERAGPRILCGTDGGRSAAAAAARAARLARACGGDVELMHVIPPRQVARGRAGDGEADRRDVATDARARLRAVAADLEVRFDVPVSVHLAFGVAHAQIAARAAATDARLVVVGPHDERPVRAMFVASTAQHLRRLLHVPLLVARSRSTRGYERVLVAIDFSPASAQAAHAAADLFPGAALHFLHVCNPLFESRVAMADGGENAVRVYRNRALLQAGRELDTFIRRNGLAQRRASSLVRRGYPPACIASTANELRASLVAFGAPGRSHVEAALLGSSSATFMGGIGPDVLLAKATRRRLHDRDRADARVVDST